ncbi:hypothetical protein GV054_15275 [Marinomonas mediterranea]|uniref:RHS repeat-associated core domain-containing protein n=1 Tax=Marinomonas mediterranea TaxID=119864 RepID=UPI00234A7256|nr:RHS repeat-associated core domain-containing protein [Marinomonas mediterranea]WCN14256.1 hypothetical protein GV054_15275 [Marinomonas mediterranea]
MTSGDGRTFQYSSFNKPNRISKGSEVFTYGPDQARFKKVNTGTVASTTYYIGAYEKEIRDGHTYHRIQLGDFAIVEKVDSNAEKVTYTLRDDLNTLIATVSETGDVKRLFYDPWGKRMDLPTIGNAQPIDIISLANFGIHRGFTNHEHLDNVGLIHMNGRVYDPEIARFTSADPIIQDPTYLQNYNRYSYTWNNPLRYTDPSGFEIDDDGSYLDPYSDDYDEESGEGDAKDYADGHYDNDDGWDDDRPSRDEYENEKITPKTSEPPLTQVTGTAFTFDFFVVVGIGFELGAYYGDDWGVFGSIYGGVDWDTGVGLSQKLPTDVNNYSGSSSEVEVGASGLLQASQNSSGMTSIDGNLGIPTPGGHLSAGIGDYISLSSLFD